MEAMDIQNSLEHWRITYHFVWSPMRAKACLSDVVAERLRDLIAERAREMACEPITLVILPDRVYLAAAAPPTLAPHSIICQVKAYTSRVLRDEFPELTRIPSLWTRAYLVVAGDALDPEELFRHFEALMPDRRPRGRPRKCAEPTAGDD
jgi:putative transposase